MRPHTFEGGAQCSKSWPVMERLFGNQMVSVSSLTRYPLQPQWIQPMIQNDRIARQKNSPGFAGSAGWHFEVGGDTMGRGVSWMEQVAIDFLVTNWRTQNVWQKLGSSRDFSVRPFLGTGGRLVIIILLCHRGMFPLVPFILVWALDSAAILCNNVYFMRRNPWEAISMTDWHPGPMGNPVIEGR